MMKVGLDSHLVCPFSSMFVGANLVNKIIISLSM